MLVGKNSTIKRYSTINAYLKAANTSVRTDFKEFFITKISDLGNQVVPFMTAIQKDFYQINFITQHDTGTYRINLKDYQQLDNCLYFISPDHIYSWMRKSQLDGYLIYFKKSLFKPIMPSFEIELYPFFSIEQDNMLILDDEAVIQVDLLIEQLHHFYKTQTQYRAKLTTTALLTLIFYVNSLYTNKFDATSKSIAFTLVHRYKNLVRNQFLEKKKVHQYAALLNVTPNHLNAVCKQQTGKTAKAWIDQTVLEEAKLQLAYSNLSIKEIAYNLGFSEPTNFTRFFKKYTDQSPHDFVSRIKEH